jgi:hypothetical protein
VIENSERTAGGGEQHGLEVNLATTGTSSRRYLELAGWLLLFLFAMIVFVSAGGAAVAPVANEDPVNSLAVQNTEAVLAASPVDSNPARATTL